MKIKLTQAQTWYLGGSLLWEDSREDRELGKRIRAAADSGRGTVYFEATEDEVVVMRAAALERLDDLTGSCRSVLARAIKALQEVG